MLISTVNVVRVTRNIAFFCVVTVILVDKGDYNDTENNRDNLS